jgi:hypothetical protein
LDSTVAHVKLKYTFLWTVDASCNIFYVLLCFSVYFLVGTDLWEANLRNGGQPPPSQTQKTPWGHTPTSNIGGTWGEDDDVGDSSNVWTGVTSSAGPGGATGQWGANNTRPSGGMWGGASCRAVMVELLSLFV